MYVRLYNKILDSSIADNRKLRHFFTDLLLCADPDGNVIMTKAAIAKRTGATLEEVEWGLEILMNSDPETHTTENEGRRIVPLDGCGYGWKILNYEVYRDFKTARDMREATAERVRKWRAQKKLAGGGEVLCEPSPAKPSRYPKKPRRRAVEPGGDLVKSGADPDEVAEMVAREMESNRQELEAKAAAAGPVETEPAGEGVVV